MDTPRSAVVGVPGGILRPYNALRLLGWLWSQMEQVERTRPGDVAEHRDGVRDPGSGGTLPNRTGGASKWSKPLSFLDRFEPRDTIALIAMLGGLAYCLLYKMDPTNSGFLMLLLGWIVRATVAN